MQGFRPPASGLPPPPLYLIFPLPPLALPSLLVYYYHYYPAHHRAAETQAISVSQLAPIKLLKEIDQCVVQTAIHYRIHTYVCEIKTVYCCCFLTTQKQKKKKMPQNRNKKVYCKMLIITGKTEGELKSAYRQSRSHYHESSAII